MLQIETNEKLPRVIEINPALSFSETDEFANFVMAENDSYVELKELEGIGENVEFTIACDALTIWRIRWRFIEEFGERTAIRLSRLIACKICQDREYDLDDFQLAMEATRRRARLPYGFGPLQLALKRCQRNPIEIINPSLKHHLCATILGIAIQLDLMNGEDPVLLPIDNLRQLLGCRKIIASGAVQKLMLAGLIEECGPKSHTGRAREFRVCAVEYRDYKKKEPVSNECPVCIGE